MYIHVHYTFLFFLFFSFFFDIQMTCKNPRTHKYMTYEIYKIYEGDTCSSGVFMVCFESSIIYLVKKILRRKGGTWLIKIVQNGNERIVTAITVFC